MQFGRCLSNFTISSPKEHSEYFHLRSSTFRSHSALTYDTHPFYQIFAAEQEIMLHFFSAFSRSPFKARPDLSLFGSPPHGKALSGVRPLEDAAAAVGPQNFLL